MKKKNLINLIRYHEEKNEAAFRAEALEVAKGNALLNGLNIGTNNNIIFNWSI